MIDYLIWNNTSKKNDFEAKNLENWEFLKNRECFNMMKSARNELQQIADYSQDRERINNAIVLLNHAIAHFQKKYGDKQ